MVVVRALKRRQSKCQVSVVHPREGNTFVTKVEKEVRKYDVDVSVKRELTWPEGAMGIPLMLATAEELLRTAMVNNHIDMKQEMADRITHACASAFRSEGEALQTHMSSNHLEAKCQGARIAPWWSSPYQRICVGHIA